MQELDIPIFKKTYDLYKSLYLLRAKVPKQDRYTIFQKCDNALLDLLESIMEAGQTPKSQKLIVLEKANLKLGFLRVFVRLMKDVKTIDLKTYAVFEESLDEIGRMLGGWIRSTKE
jgi:hypothetical protein